MSRSRRAEFIDFVRKYDTTWSPYRYFPSAVTFVKADLVFTMGSFGSSPGVFGRSGWLAATVPILKDVRIGIKG